MKKITETFKYRLYRISTFVLLLVIVGIVWQRFMDITNVEATVPVGYITWKKQVYPDLYWQMPLNILPSSHSGDVNGDGLIDVLNFPNSGSGSGSVVINTVSPGGSTPGYVYDATYSASLNALGDLKSFWRPSQISAAGIRVVDINNDGLVDILQKVVINSVVYEGVYINTGAGWEKDPRYTIPVFFGTQNFEYNVPLFDLNGDGLLDIIFLPNNDEVYLASPAQ